MAFLSANRSRSNPGGKHPHSITRKTSSTVSTWTRYLRRRILAFTASHVWRPETTERAPEGPFMKERHKTNLLPSRQVSFINITRNCQFFLRGFSNLLSGRRRLSSEPWFRRLKNPMKKPFNRGKEEEEGGATEDGSPGRTDIKQTIRVK